MKLKLNKTAREWLKAQGACSECFPWACQNGATLAELVPVARPDWALWVLLRPGVLTDRAQWLFACWCAEQALPNWYVVYPDDHRPRQAIEARRGWLLGSVSNEELSAAESAARSAAELAAELAAESARLARSAARSATWLVAESARLAWSAARSATWLAAESARLAESAESAARSAAELARLARSAESAAW
jgi:hypothetical protein